MLGTNVEVYMFGTNKDILMPVYNFCLKFHLKFLLFEKKPHEQNGVDCHFKN